MPGKRCYIHVGLPKTGTSYVQSILWASSAYLLEQGVALVPPRRERMFQVLQAMRNQPDPDRAQAVLARARARADAAPGDRVLVSHEVLGGESPRNVQRLVDAFDGHELHVVVTVRDIASVIPSAWQQYVKSRGTMDLHAYTEAFTAGFPEASLDRVLRRRSQRTDVHAVLDRWAGHVPPERLHVVVVPPRTAPRTLLLERFCEVLDVDPAGLVTDAPAGNISIGLPQAELLRRVNVALGDRLRNRQQGYRAQRTYLTRTALRPQAGPPARMPHDTRAWCEKASQGVIDRILAGGYPVVGDLDELRPDPARFADADQTVHDEDVTAAAVEAIAVLMTARAAQEDELARLRRTVQRQERRIQRLAAASRRQPPPGNRLAGARARLVRLSERVRG